MTTLDNFTSAILSASDNTQRLTLGADILQHVRQVDPDVSCDNMAAFVDALASWTKHSNYKVCQNALDILNRLVVLLRPEFRPFISAVLSCSVDRLGDVKDVVRHSAFTLLLSLMSECGSTQQVADKLVAASSCHRSAKVREQLLQLLHTAVNSFDSPRLHVSSYVSTIVALLSDATPAVREAATNTMVEIYKHVGDRLRIDLRRKHDVAPAKLAALMFLFDQVRDAGQMMASSMSSDTLSSITSSDGQRQIICFSFNFDCDSCFAIFVESEPENWMII